MKETVQFLSSRFVISMVCLVFVAMTAGALASTKLSIAVLLTLPFLLAVVLTASSDKMALLGVSIVTIYPAHLPAMPGLPRDALQKAAIFVFLVILIHRHGWRRNRALTVLACIILLLTLYGFYDTELLNRIGSDGILRAGFGFLFAWVALSINWDRESAIACLTFVARLPTISIAFGVLLQIFGIGRVYGREYTGAFRLAGGLIPAHLAMLAYVAILASLIIIVLNLRTRVKPWLAANLLILVLTVTRGAILATVVMVVIFAGLCILYKEQDRVVRGAKNFALMLFLLGILAVSPLIALRDGQQEGGGINTSGRDEAWEFFLSFAHERPLLGNGLGFSNVAFSIYRPNYDGSVFSAPHNEYIHYFIDTGIVGGLLILSVMVFIFARVANVMPRPGKLLLTSAFVGLAVYSISDNVLSTPQLTVPLALTLGAASVLNRRAPDVEEGSVDGERFHQEEVVR